MKTKNILGSLTGSILLTIVTSAVYFPASARDPFTKEELKAQEKKLLAVVEEGYNIWHGSNPTTQNNGLACGNCHPDAAVHQTRKLSPNITLPSIEWLLGVKWLIGVFKTPKVARHWM